MLSYVARRLLGLLPLLLLVSFIVFFMSQLIPGDPARTLLGFRATQAQVREKQHQMGIDRPEIVQYGDWLRHAVVGDLGNSYFRPDEKVLTEIKRRLPRTANMAIGALVVTILLGLPIGLLAGTRPQSIADRLVTFGTSTAISLPDFWLAMMLAVFMAVKLQWVPARGYAAGPFDRIFDGYVWDSSANIVDWAKHLVMVWLAVGIPGAAGFARQLRGAVIDAMEQDYVRTARAKGMRGRVIVLKHALKNASLIPVTVLGLQFAYTLGGTVVLETIFSLGGMGEYFEHALGVGDLPIIQGVTLLVAMTFLVVNLAVDVLYAYLNPRVRLG